MLADLESFFSLSATFFKGALEQLEEYARRAVLFVSTHKLLIAIMVGYSVVFSWYDILRYYALRDRWLDLGDYNHSFWVLLYGGKQASVSAMFFAGHFSPILLAFLPLYAVSPGPPTLLVLQSLVLGLAALPIYLLVHDATADSKVATLIASAYLLYAPLHGVNAFDFHSEIFFPLVLSSAILFWRRGNWRAYYASLILAVGTQEFAPVLIVAMGIGSFLQSLVDHRRRIPRTIIWHCALTIFFGIGVYFFDVKLAALGSSGTAGAYLAGELKSITLPVSSGFAIPSYFLRHPVAGFLSLFADLPAKFEYLIEVFTPTMFLPILTPLSLIPFVAWVGLAFLTKFEPYYSIYFQYSAYGIAFIFSALATSLAKLAMPAHAMRRIAIAIFFVTLLTSGYVSILSPMNPVNGNPQNPLQSNWWPTRTAHQDSVNEVVRLIPQDGLLLTQNDLGSVTSGRREIWIAGLSNAGRLPDFILADLTSDNFFYIQGASITAPEYTLYPFLVSLVQNGSYGVYAYSDGVLLYKRNYYGPPVLFADPYNATFNPTQFLTNGFAKIVEDQTSSTGTALACLEQNTFWFWYGPYVLLPPGTYNITYRLKVSSLSEGHVLTVDVVAGAEQIKTYEIAGSNFTQPSKWQNFTYSFHLDAPTANVEFRGFDPSQSLNIYLDYVTLTQISV
jgi:uncharacterized membrane protein